MVRLILIALTLLTGNCCFSQYYLRGELKNELDKPVPNAKISLFSKGSYPFNTGSSGGFGIPSSLKIDTITFTAEGYEPLKVAVETSKYQVLIIKMNKYQANASRLRLSSVTRDLVNNKPFFPNIDGETYAATVENKFLPTRQFPQTGFAVNVDRASYSNIRRFINNGSQPPADAVRIEELLNYFNLKPSAAADPKKVFEINTHLTTCPWNIANRLLFIHLQAKKINLDHTPPSNLVFLIDVSGSMDTPNKLPLLQSAFKLLAANLRRQDTVSIVTYGDKVAVALPPTGGANKQLIVETIESLRADGVTPGESAIRLAYKVAKSTFKPGANNRVIMATDGDFNIGQTSEEALENLIEQEKQSGIYLTCLGVGMGNYKDSKLETLAKKGNGNFAYIDTEAEAQKVVVEEFAQTMYTVASDVHLKIDFDPEQVSGYRLIGFDNRRNAIANKLSSLEGGEVGSGHSLMAVFEITPASGVLTAQPGTLQLSYTQPGHTVAEQTSISIKNNITDLATADRCFGFAASVIMFGNLLKHSEYTGQADWNQLYTIAAATADTSDKMQAGFLDLVQKAGRLYKGSKQRN